MNQLEKTIDKLTLENKKLNENLIDKNRQLIRNEIEHEELQNQHRYLAIYIYNIHKIISFNYREAQSIIADLESKIDKTLEKLAIVQSELEESKTESEEQLERLKQKLIDSESEVIAYQRRSKAIFFTNDNFKFNIIASSINGKSINNQSDKSKIYEKKPVEKAKNNKKTLAAIDLNENMHLLASTTFLLSKDKMISPKIKVSSMLENAFKKKLPIRANEILFHKIEDKENHISMTPKVGNLVSLQKNYTSGSFTDLKKVNKKGDFSEKSFETDSKFKDFYDVKQQKQGFTKSLSIVNSLIKVLDRKPKEKQKITSTNISPWVASGSLTSRKITSISQLND